MALISERLNCSSFLCNRFPDLAVVRVPSYFVGGGGTSSWVILHFYYVEMVW